MSRQLGNFEWIKWILSAETSSHAVGEPLLTESYILQTINLVLTENESLKDNKVNPLDRCFSLATWITPGVSIGSRSFANSPGNTRTRVENLSSRKLGTISKNNLRGNSLWITPISLKLHILLSFSDHVQHALGHWILKQGIFHALTHYRWL